MVRIIEGLVNHVPISGWTNQSQQLPMGGGVYVSSLPLYFSFFFLLLCRVFALCWRATLVERSAVINVCNENRKYFYVTYTPSSGDAMTIRKGRKGGWCSRPLTFTRLRGGSVQRKHLESMSWEANRWSGGVCAGLGSSIGRPGG